MKILVCVDGSVQCQNVIQEAAKMAKLMQEVELTLLYVAKEIEANYGEDYKRQEEHKKKVEQENKQEGREVLEAAEEYYAERGIEINKALKKGDPATVITEYAEDNEYDLIMIGNRGESGIKKFLLGNVSEAVAQKASTNVLITKCKL